LHEKLFSGARDFGTHTVIKIKAVESSPELFGFVDSMAELMIDTTPQKGSANCFGN
jgi:hypothetical protein